MFPEEQVPAFNIPKIGVPPAIDGKIGADEWKQSVEIMGMANAHSNSYVNRPHSFRVAWDDNHIYISGSAHVLKGHKLLKSRRDKFTTGVVFDDSYEFGVGMMGRNKLPSEVESYFKFIINYLGCGEYLKMYPSIGQYLYNWRPDMKIASSLRDAPDGQYWDIEISLDLNDLQMPVPNKAGDKIKILLANDGKNPGWVWAHVPSSTGYLVHTGFPTATFTADRPYAKIEKLDGLEDEKISFKSEIFNPSAKPVKVKARLEVINEGQVAKEPAKKIGVEEEKVLEIPANSSARFDLEKDFPGFDYRNEGHPKYNQMQGVFDFKVTVPDSDEAPVMTQHLIFRKDTEKALWKYTPSEEAFRMETQYNPARSTLWITADTLDSKLPEGSKPAAVGYSVKLGDKEICSGKIVRFINYMFVDNIQMTAMQPGEYKIVIEMLDKDGKVLAARDAKFAKKDEAKDFADWWNNKIGDFEKLLKPFEALKAADGELSKTAVSCVRRVYEFDSLGLPMQIKANDGNVLTAPARIVLTVNDKDYVVPVKNKLKFKEKKDWKYTFEGEPAEIAGVKFSSKGVMEQDGLVSIELSFEPSKTPVAVQELKIEWPVDDKWGNHMACMGVGGNYSARFIGRIPAGNGPVWSTLNDIGKAGSGMTLGNFYQNLWIGTEFRGLLWWANSDEGWVPDDLIAAHDILRDGGTTTVRNHLIGTYPGKAPYNLEKKRTVKFSYNASPFKALTKGWRLNLRSAANGFSGGKYKVNWDTKEDFFSILSPPFQDRKRWPEYYAHCKEQSDGISMKGIYGPEFRLGPYMTNQIALRGYMNKTIEPGLYDYFGPEWNTNDSGEPLNPTYADYMMWLQQKQVKEGGCRHFYYDISMCGRISKSIPSGMGYFLDNGQIQPSGTDETLRYWYKRAYAMMQENGLFPSGISGHATQTIPLVALPFSDAILDSEFPMADPITVYPSDRMIALSVPEAFGCNINHLGFMNPNWAAMHDSGMGGGHGSVFDKPEWRNWGIESEDVKFIPYWRNGNEVRIIGNGLIASIWKRKNSAVIAVMNYGLDSPGFEKNRSCELTLNLGALGVPENISKDMIRIRDFDADKKLDSRRYDIFKWYKELPGTPAPWNKDEIWRYEPEISPNLDSATGSITGFDIFYHHQRYLLLSWETGPVKDSEWKNDFQGNLRNLVLDWGIDDAKEVKGDDVKSEAGSFDVRAWKRPGSLLVKATNPGKENSRIELKLDLEKLGVKLKPENLWAEFTQIFDLENKPVRNIVWAEVEKDANLLNGGTACFEGHLGKVVLMLKPGETRVFSIDKY